MGKIINRSFAFLIIVILSATLITIYNLIGQEDFANSTDNYNPLPSVHPSDLPESNMIGDVPGCLSKPTLCEPDNTCSCGSYSGNVTCTDPQNYIPYEFGSIKIPDDGNSYCIPSDLANMPCNKYTGKYVWTDDAVGQRWKCECLYPDLYDDPSTGCTKQVACINDVGAVETGLVSDQSNNKLALVTSLFINNPPKYWDPNSTDDSTELMNSPYSSLTQDDIDSIPAEHKETLSNLKPGDPKYVCACGVKSNGEVINETNPPPYVRLPNDPYNCHIDKCEAYVGYGLRSMLTSKTQIPGCGENNEPDADCTCAINEEGDCANGSAFLVKFGKNKGICYPNETPCKEVNIVQGNAEGTYIFQKEDKYSGTCSCPVNTLGRMCINENVSINDITEFNPDFINDENPQKIWRCNNNEGCINGECDTTVDPDNSGRGVCKCLDPENVVGAECISPCDPNPCQNNTMCKLIINNEDPQKSTFTCDCMSNYNGDAKFPDGLPGQDDPDIDKIDGIFKLDGEKDCDNKDMYVYFNNNPNTETKTCTDITALPGTTMASTGITCAFSLGWTGGEGSPTCNKFIKKSIGILTNDDTRGPEKIEGRDTGVYCQQKPSLQEAHCGFFNQDGNGWGFGEKKHTWTC